LPRARAIVEGLNVSQSALGVDRDLAPAHVKLDIELGNQPLFGQEAWRAAGAD
jgi:hypothetical protein